MTMRSSPIAFPAVLLMLLGGTAFAQCEPVIVARLATTHARDVERRGSLLYLADGAAGLKIIDADDPLNPRVVGSLDTYDALDVGFNGPKVVLADERQGVLFIDCEDIARPRLAARVHTGVWAAAVHALGDEVYVGRGSDLALYDIDELDAPVLLGSGWCRAVDHLDAELGIAVVVDTNMGVVDARDEHNPQLVAEHVLPGTGWAVDYDDLLAYTANGTGGLAIVDLADPRAPRTLSITPPPGTEPFHEVQHEEGIAYVGGWGLRLFDVSDPTAPRLLGASADDTPIYGLAIAGTLAFAAAGDQGLLVYNMAGCLSCPADLDGDGELTIFDFLEFQNLFDTGDPRADFDGDGALTIFDFLAFQNAFDAGC